MFWAELWTQRGWGDSASWQAVNSRQWGDETERTLTFLSICFTLSPSCLIMLPSPTVFPVQKKQYSQYSPLVCLHQKHHSRQSPSPTGFSADSHYPSMVFPVTETTQQTVILSINDFPCDRNTTADSHHLQLVSLQTVILSINNFPCDRNTTADSHTIHKWFSLQQKHHSRESPSPTGFSADDHYSSMIFPATQTTL